MTTYVGLPRAVNVGGTGRISMKELAGLCRDLGFSRVETLLNSGNVVFDSGLSEARVKAALEEALRTHMGVTVGAMVRTGAEMRGVLDGNPFAGQDSKFTVAIFLDGPPPPDAARAARGATSEEIRLGAREIYVHYPEGMGRSKLVIPAAKSGAARNMNTIGKLADMAARA